MQRLTVKLLTKAIQRRYQAAETEEEKSAAGVGIGERARSSLRNSPDLRDRAMHPFRWSLSVMSVEGGATETEREREPSNAKPL